MSAGLVIGTTDPVLMWCLREALDHARHEADQAGLHDVGLVVGSPRAEQWEQIRQMPYVVAMLGTQIRGGAYTSLLVERADVLCLPEPADLAEALNTTAPCVTTGVPQPPETPPPEDMPDARVERIHTALEKSVDPPDPTTVAVVAGAGGSVTAHSAAAWHQYRPVVALVDGPAPLLLRAGGALVASTTLLAYEALDLLARGAPLRRALARRGQAALRQMPSTAEVSSRILEAMVLASGGRDRTPFLSS